MSDDTEARRAVIATPPKLAAGDAGAIAIAVDWLDKHGMIEVSTGAPSQYTAGSLAALLADVRRETIEACAAWLEKEMGDPYEMKARARLVRKKFSTDSVGEATESQEKKR